jgi:hypothetical protein
VVRLFGHPDAKDERACEQDASAAKYRSCPVHPSRSFHGRAVADVHRTSIAEEGTPEQCVVTLSTEQRVVPEVAGEVVVAIPTVYDVITGTAEQIVVALVAGDVVGAGLTRRKVVARTALTMSLPFSPANLSSPEPPMMTSIPPGASSAVSVAS